MKWWRRVWSWLVPLRDDQRAAVLETIARGAAAMVVAQFPTAGWAKLLELVFTAIAAAAGSPTRSAPAMERAAARALTELGRNPGTADAHGHPAVVVPDVKRPPAASGH